MLAGVSATDPKSPPRVLLVDGTNSLYRAFFAIPHLRAPDGSPTNAAYGFVNMLGKVIREEQPDYAVVVFDAPGETFRHRLFDAYKAGRDATPENLSAQFPVVRELLAAHRVPVVEVADFEADDVIATLVSTAPPDARITIVSTDKDLMQLVSERVTLLDGIKDRRIGPAEVEARFGVPPERLLDLRALVGDPSDNIPGVKGIGEKGAAALIAEWGSLEALLAHAEEVKAKRARTALLEFADDAQLSKRLATLRTDTPLPLGWDAALRAQPDTAALRGLYERLGFTRLLGALAADGDGAAAPTASDSEVSLECAEDARALAALVAKLAELPSVPLSCVFGPGGPLAGDAVGMAFATGEASAVYVPLGASRIDLAEVVAQLRPLFEAPGRTAWIAYDAKRIQMLFAECGVELAVPHFDVEIAGRLIDPAGAKSLSAIAAQHLGIAIPMWEDLAGRGAKARPAADIDASELAAWAGRQVCAVRALHAPLAARLDEDGLGDLFDAVELPTTRVLARMECAGVRVDEEGLAALAAEYQQELAQIEAGIFDLAGEKFLVSSPKQLQRILFEKLALSPIKKTKTGYSTDESVLEQLAVDHELPARILAYRHLAKLLSTYVVALPPLINERTGRIHPTFNQLGAATGRLSANHPNVQNIPIRSPEGVRIRERFIAADGCSLLSSDYSQVELRLLAHYSGDPGLVGAFERGEDIHRQTAAEVRGIAAEAVTDEERARAKAINFGILYGLSAFGLATQLGIAAAEAQETIDAYFDRYRGVREFLDRTVAEARECGFTTTLLGRRRYLPDLGSRNRTLRQAAERMATNSVLQGTAADLIKKAMVDLDRALAEQGLATRMILQVHDELVFEVPEKEVEEVQSLVRERMEGVAALRVPLVVDLGMGKNWRQAH
jgi:DNA polymerase-1